MNTSLKKFHGTKTPGEFNSIVFGDVHINHANTTAHDTLPILHRIIEPTEKFKLLDMIFIEGDFFDSLMQFNNEHLGRITYWIILLLKRCAEFNIALRVLEGTPSHDMKQNRCFVYYNDIYNIGCDLKYFDDLDIEQNEQLGVDILYLPDEWDSPLENCYTAAKKLIALKGMSQVDYAIMHGNFEYQLPKVMGIAAHNSSLWQELVRYNILIGHVHTHSKYGKIVASGSLNRLRHGEESPKGWCSVVGYADGSTNVTFHEAKDAKTYLTVTVPEADTDAIIEFINDTCKDLRPDSYIKWAHPDKIVLHSVLNYAEMSYPEINFSCKEIELDEVKQESILPKLEKGWHGIDITKHNVVKLIVDEMERRDQSDMVEEAKRMLLEVIDEL